MATASGNTQASNQPLKIINLNEPMNKPTSTAIPRWVAMPRWINPAPSDAEISDDRLDIKHPSDVYVFFVAAFPQAERVRLIGSFSGWEKHPIAMDRAQNGTWFATLPLAPGRYEYAYLVDDQWQLDPDSTQVAHRFGPRVNACVV